MKLAGMTTNDGFFGSANFVGRIGSPTLMLWIVILPSAWSAVVIAAAGFASRLNSCSLTSAGVSVVLAGISRAATSTATVGTATGWSLLAPEAYTNVPTPATRASATPTMRMSRARRREPSCTLSSLSSVLCLADSSQFFSN